ncbi:MAG: secondary thiamine-phosphate synthase enzyme YjbQ [candidate division Zixibacteria bacterium]
MSKPIRIDVKTDRRNQLVDITSRIQKLVAESDIDEGYAILFVPHTTAAVTINENADPSVKSDILGYLEKLIPQNAGFAHAEGNSDAHIKASLTGFSETILISEGRLLLGTWQGIYFCEYDGPRSRELILKFISD